MELYIDLITFAPILRCTADHDFWIRDMQTHHKCLAVIVDDSLIFSQDGMKILDCIKTNPLASHLTPPLLTPPLTPPLLKTTGATIDANANGDDDGNIVMDVVNDNGIIIAAKQQQQYALPLKCTRFGNATPSTIPQSTPLEQAKYMVDMLIASLPVQHYFQKCIKLQMECQKLEAQKAKLSQDDCFPKSA